MGKQTQVTESYFEICISLEKLKDMKTFQVMQLFGFHNY